MFFKKYVLFFKPTIHKQQCKSKSGIFFSLTKPLSFFSTISLSATNRLVRGAVVSLTLVKTIQAV